MGEKATSGFFAAGRVRLSMLWPLVLLAATFHGAGSERAWSQSTAGEYHVKAAFLFHFTQLVEWPPDTLSRGDNSLFLCTLGEDPFHGQLEETVEGKQIRSRTLRIRHGKTLQDTRGCNLLFISTSEGTRIPALLTSLRSAPVLTVGEADGFLQAGGIIRFCLEGNKVRFEINRDAAESAKLRISSQLLLLAKNVVGGK